MDGGEGNESSDTREGMFLCWGYGEFGQHCHEVKEDVPSESSAVEFFCGSTSEDRVKFVACGSSHTMVVTDSNDIYAWGNGSSGQLGLGDKDSRPVPEKMLLYANQTKPASVAGVACGGRHTFVWLDNGQMFSFGNNVFAQLGYDFRIKNYKENQTKPHLIQNLVHRPVEVVACGQKHSVFLFKDGAVAAVGSNTHGQIGSGDVQEAIVPKFNEDLKSVRLLTCGANHTVVVDEDGSVFTWGFGRACGNRNKDVLSPIMKTTRRKNIIALAAGSSHSLALTANGNLYSWGSGVDGQLGHGDSVRFLSQPKRVRHPSLRGCVAAIACREGFSAAVTEDGSLYMFGRNNHTITNTKPPNTKMFTPYRVDTGGFPVCLVSCGAWHAAAMSGVPAWSKASDESDLDTDEETESVQARRRKNGDYYISDESDLASGFSSDTEDVLLPPLAKTSTLIRDKTSVSIADFYAPTPDGRRTGLELVQEDQELSPRLETPSVAKQHQGWPRRSLQSPASKQSPVESVDDDSSVVVSPMERSPVENENFIQDNVEQASSANTTDLRELPSNQTYSKETMDTNNNDNKGKKPFVLENIKRSEEELHHDLPPHSSSVPAYVSSLPLHVPGISPNGLRQSKTMVPDAPVGPLQFSSKSFDSYEMPRESTVLASKTIGISENNMVTGSPRLVDAHKPANVARRIELRQQQLMEKHRARHQQTLLQESRGRGKRMRNKIPGVGYLDRFDGPVRSSSDSNIYGMREDLQNLTLTAKPPIPGRSPSLPKPVSFVGGSAKKIIRNPPIKKHAVSIPNKLSSQKKAFAIAIENPRQKPVFSSASSWRNEEDILLLGSGNRKIQQRSPDSRGKNHGSPTGSSSAPAVMNRSAARFFDGRKPLHRTSSDDSSHDESDELRSAKFDKRSFRRPVASKLIDSRNLVIPNQKYNQSLVSFHVSGIGGSRGVSTERQSNSTKKIESAFRIESFPPEVSGKSSSS